MKWADAVMSCVFFFPSSLPQQCSECHKIAHKFNRGLEVSKEMKFCDNKVKEGEKKLVNDVIDL